MRLVLDTNVLVSDLLSPNSVSAQVLNWGEDNGIVLSSETELITQCHCVSAAWR
ncbi:MULTISPECIES: hypothetical protein [Aphanizomenon]|uniref:hypothetical protein n=1 Tax=Aphanizomenon TaxID=1175 RepID=UPI0015805E65|nr:MULTISPECIES: hypothetical protein [Aphanizomenon]